MAARAVASCGKLGCLAADDMLPGTPAEINIRSVLVARRYPHTLRQGRKAHVSNRCRLEAQEVGPQIEAIL